MGREGAFDLRVCAGEGKWGGKHLGELTNIVGQVALVRVPAPRGETNNAACSALE